MNWIIYSQPRAGSWLVLHHIHSAHSHSHILELGQNQSVPLEGEWIAKSHFRVLPTHVNRWSCVCLRRRDHFHQYLSTRIHHRVQEWQHYTHQKPSPFWVYPSHMIKWCDEIDSYEQWQDHVSSLQWAHCYQLEFEQFTEQPEILSQLTGTRPCVKTQPSPYRP